MDDEMRKITVNLPENMGKIEVGNVPIDVRCGTLIDRLYCIPILQDFKGKLAISIDGIRLISSDCVDSDEIDLVVYEAPSKFTAHFLVLLYFIFTHLALFWMRKKKISFYKMAFIYDGMIFILVGLCSILELKTNKLIPEEDKPNPVLEIPLLFLKSLSPNFNLEQLLVHE